MEKNPNTWFASCCIVIEYSNGSSCDAHLSQIPKRAVERISNANHFAKTWWGGLHKTLKCVPHVFMAFCFNHHRSKLNVDIYVLQIKCCSSTKSKASGLAACNCVGARQHAPFVLWHDRCSVCTKPGISTWSITCIHGLLGEGFVKGDTNKQC